MVNGIELSREALADGLDALFAKIFAPWSVMPPRDWAETIRRMPGGYETAQPFTFAYAPYQLEPYLECFNPRNIEVDLMWFSRGGKSEIVQNVLGRTIHQKPCRIGVMWPTLGQAKKWSKDDFMGSLVDPTPELYALIGDGTGRRKSDNTLLHKIFTGGLIDMVGANAVGDLRRMKYRLGYGDEIDAIVEITSDEGSQLEIFAKRGSEYADTIQIYCSYPSLKGKSRIEPKLLQSDLRVWISICLKCGDEFVMHRTGLGTFGDKYLRSTLLFDADKPHLARLECPHCKTQHDDHARHRMMMGGDPEKPRYDLWRATREFRGRAGFHANSMLWPHKYNDPDYLAKYPGGYLHELAARMLSVDASENPERSRRVLVNADDAETYQSASDVKPEHSKLFRRREAWAGLDEEGNANPWDRSMPVPTGVLCVGFFTDVQDDRLEMFIEGWGINDQVWQLAAIVIKGGKGCALALPTEGVWAEHDHLLETVTFAHPSGKTLRILGGLVDAGDKRDAVFAYTRPRAGRKIYASRGDTELCKPVVEFRARKEGKHKTKVWVLGTHAAKEILYTRLDQDAPTSTGYRHYPVAGWCSETFFKQLTAENSEDRQARDGKWYKWFGCEQGVRNEALDGAVGCMAAKRILKPNFEKLLTEFSVDGKAGTAEVLPPGKTSAKEGGAAAKRASKPGRSFVSGGRTQGGVRRPGGFVSGWR